MIVRRLDDAVGGPRDVRGPTFNSRRLLLAEDRMGFSLHDTVLYAGTETLIHYKHHLEAVYCLEGEAEVEVLPEGPTHAITPGTLYALDGHERHLLRVKRELRAVCVFNPALTGGEVHGPDGAYQPSGAAGPGGDAPGP